MNAAVAVPKTPQNFISCLLVWKGLVQMAFWSCKMYFGMRRSGRKTPVPSHKSFCFRTGDPGFTSGVDGWALSGGLSCSSAFGLVCAAADGWPFEVLLGGGVWLNAVDAKNQRKKAQRRVIDLLLSPNGEHAVGRSPETQAAASRAKQSTSQLPKPRAQFAQFL